MILQTTTTQTNIKLQMWQDSLKHSTLILFQLNETSKEY